MRVSGIISIVMVLTMIISLVCIWFYPSEQDFTVSNTSWNGISKFRQQFDVDTVDSLDNISQLSEKAVLITIPSLDYRDDELAKIKQFLGNGGSLIVMDDYGYGNRILEYLDVSVRFSNKPLLDPLFCYKNQWLPRISTLSLEAKVHDIDVVMLNHSTALIDATQEDIIAQSSVSSFLDINENEILDSDEPAGPFAVAAQLPFGNGTLTLVSDPSIIINTMLTRDNNYAFTGYITGDIKESRKIVIDRSHLDNTSLDVSKTRLSRIRDILSSQYALFGITVIIVAVISLYILRRRTTID